MSTVRVSDAAVHVAAKVRAAREGTTLSALVTAALRAYAEGEAPMERAAAAMRPFIGGDVELPRSAEQTVCGHCHHRDDQHVILVGSKLRFCRQAGCACRIP